MSTPRSTALLATTGPGSVAARQALLDRRYSTARPPAEADFLVGLFTGELAAGRARRADGRRDRARVRVSGAGRSAAPRCSAATSAITAERAFDRRRRRARRRAARSAAPGAADARGELGRRRRMRCRKRASRRSSGSSTVRASRCTERGDDVRVFTRNLNDVTDRLPEVVALARSFSPRTLVLDGETIGIAADERPHRVPGHDEPVRSRRRGHS